MSQRIIAYTDAPTDYDYGWMQTEVENFALAGDKVLRKCSNVDQWHLDQQLMRYGSGLHYGLTQRQFNEHLESGIIVLTPEKQIVHHRAVIVIPENYDYSTDNSFFKVYENYAYGEGKTDNVKVESGAFGGGPTEVKVHVIGDKELFDKIIEELTKAMAS